MTNDLLSTTPKSQFHRSSASSSSPPPTHHHSLGLDDTFILMSSADYESTPILIRHSLPQNVLNNDYSQQQTKPLVVEAPRNVEQEPGPSTSRSGPADGGANDPVEIGVGGVNPTGQGADQSVGGGAGGSEQPPDGGGRGGGPAVGAEADESHEQQSGESTTTSGSMPELVAPPPDPFLIPLLYPAPLLSSPDGQSIEVDHSDESRASEATTAQMGSDNEGQDQQQRGVHIIAVTNTSSTSTSSTNAVLSSSSSSVVKQPFEYLDTTLSSMSTFTSTSSSGAKVEKGKSTSDSSGHLDVSKDEKSFDVSKDSNLNESTADLLSQDMFCGRDEFFVSTPATEAVASTSRLPFNIETRFEESEDSEFVVPPSPTELTSPTSSTDMIAATVLDSTEHSRTEKRLRKRPTELTLDRNLPSTEDLQLVGPSRRAAATMAVKATIGDFLIKSMHSAVPVTDVVNDEALINEVDLVPPAVSLRKRQGATADDVEPSAKVIRKIAFDSQTSSDESAQLLTALSIDRAKCSDEKLEVTSSVLQHERLTPGLVTPFASQDVPLGETSGVKPCSAGKRSGSDAVSDKERVLSESAMGVADSSGSDSVIADSQTINMNVDDTEEDEVAVEQLILRYSPSQTAESQYFPLVSETCTSESEKLSKFSPVKVGLRLGDDSSAITVEDSSQSDALPSFNLQRPCSETPNASQGISSERIDRTVPLAVPKVKAVSEERSKVMVFDESASDEENPFESYGSKTKPKNEEETTDETDTPVCPVGRHKRKVVWSENSDDQTNGAASTSKRRKPETKSFGCQVNVAELGLESVSRKVSGGQTESSIRKDRAIQTSDVENPKRGECDETDKMETDDVIIRQTIVVRRFFTEELVVRNKVVAEKQYEEEDEPLVKEHRGGSGVSVGVDFKSFARPTPPNKITPEGSGSSKSTSILSLKSSSSSSGGVLGDVSSLSKSSSSSKKDSNEDSTTQVTGDMRTLRSVRRRKCFEARKSLKLSESDSTPEPVVRKHSDDQVTPNSDTQSPVRKRGRPKLSVSRAITKPKIKFDDKTVDSVTPVTRESPVAGPSTSSTLPIESKQSSEQSLLESTTTEQGVRVMAKWRDGYFYPCRILENENDNRVKIQYVDGDIRSIKESDILTVDILPVGQSVYVMSPDGYYDSSIITDRYDDNGSVGYVVAIDSGAVRRVSRDEVILTADQAACMENISCTPPPRMVASISLDNLVEGKRRSRGFSPRSPSSPLTPRSTRTRRQTRRNIIDEDVATIEPRNEAMGSDVSVSSGKSESGKLQKSK